MRRRTSLVKTALAAVLGAVLVAGCSSSSDTGDSAAPKQSAETGPVTLTFWAWAPNIDKVVAIWNKQHPEIHVTLSTQSQGDTLVTKLLTADKAGNPPDLAQAEYQALPTLVTGGVAADLTAYTGPIKSQFTDSAWQLVSFGGKTYAVPQDYGPMMLFYRADLFTRFGLTVPKTWDEFAAAARTLRAKDPKRYLTTFSAGDPGWFAGLAEQAGASWWSIDGEKWKVDIAGEPSRKVASFWGGLVNSGVLQGQPMYTPQWNKAMNDGTLLAWPSAVWGPAVLAGIAPDTKGKWAMAPLPQWTAGEQKTGLWGGSSTAVMAKSKHQDAAAKFAVWLNTDPTAVDALVTQGSLYPAVTAGQSTPALTKAPDFMPNQPDFYQTAKQISGTAAAVTWGPDVNVTYTSYRDAFGKAIQAKSDFATALSTMQSATVADMKKLGFDLAGG
ncbi:MAG TPA: sugar ABC transporter substrate-binding protein [Mycobacteriales bacterium]|nr:sugar ABC transporter substrate-binding protein [Mycobacteriales bacterium]